MAVKGSVKRKSGEGVEEFTKRMKRTASQRSVVKVGIQSDAGNHDESGEDGETLSVADVASFHEFGTENIPQRSFIRAPIRDNKDTIMDVQARALRAVMLGTMNIKEGLSLVGEAAQADMVNAINAGIEPGLEASTIAAKGSSTPLIDSGQLKQSIRYQVED